MAEYINRGDLTIWLNKKSCEYSMDDVVPIGWTLKGLINELATFPNADAVERKTGKWIRISPAGIYECSQCGQNVMTSDIEAYKFCHGCGAKMIGGDDDGA